MDAFRVNAVFYILLATVITLILVPILYSRALRRREKQASLRQFILNDPDLRQGILDEHKKKAGKTGPAPKN